MIVALHVAAGAAAGALAGSRPRAIALGLALHGAQDAVPHHDIPSRRFEAASGLGCSPFSRSDVASSIRPRLGGAACAAPDLEHVLPLPRPGGRELYPSHRVEGWHQEGGVPAWAQLATAGVIVALVVGRPS